MATRKRKSRPEVESPTPEAVSPILSEADMVREALNSPATAVDEFTLGDRTFKVLSLSYDDYCAFFLHLQPLLEAVMDKVGRKKDVGIPGIDLGASVTAGTIAKYCGTNLPEMARIVCKQTDPTITVDEVKRLAGQPFKLVEVVLKQINQNDMIRQFTDFLAQMMPLMTAKKSS